MTVTRIHETPRVTKPYTDEQWQAIDALGHADRRAISQRGDVRLTMGGEPTFVSIDDMDGAEWNTAALGPAQAAAGRRRCCTGCATASRPAALLHFGQGKWYPGEPLPRWALGCYWRTRRRADLARPATRSPTSDADYGVTARRRRSAFIAALAERLGVDPSYAMPGLRGRLVLPVARAAAAGQRRSARQPSSTTPRSARGWRRSSSRASSSVVGYVLPLQRAMRDGRRRAGQAARGSCAASSCILIPGDSPMGYRLPLDSLPWAAPDDTDVIADLDPIAPTRCRRSTPSAARRCCAARTRHRRRRTATATPAASLATRAGAATRGGPASARRPAWIVRTALCVEPRDGHAARLPAAARRARGLPRPGRRGRRHRRASSACRCVIEGYTPPHDPRLDALQGHARPRRDRGEHPPGRELGRAGRAHRRSLYEEARADAAGHREVHARRPPHRHRRRQPHRARRRRRRPTARCCAGPICCGAWSATGTTTRRCRTCSRGLFIGPTSQAPRVDEARNDALYELEIAFAPDRRPAASRRRRGWSTALFRHLLVDVDRQHAPRRVLHRQALLARQRRRPARAARVARLRDAAARAHEPGPAAAAARRWSRGSGSSPTSGQLVRWGTRLHDRFMLPHFVRAGLQRRARRSRATPATASSRTGSRRTSSSASRASARSRSAASSSSCAQAIEPWHVLGEEAGRRRHGALRRFVASSGCRSRCAA